MVIFDIDGTVINSSGEFNPHTKEIIEELAAKGYIIAFNTSRYPDATYEITKNLNFKPYLCMASCGIIEDPNGKIIGKSPLNEYRLKEYLESILDSGFSFAVTMYDDHTKKGYVYKHNLTDTSDFSDSDLNVMASSVEVEREKFFEILTGEKNCILHMGIVANSDNIANFKQMRDIVEDATEYHIGFDLSFNNTYIDFTNSHHNKGQSVKKLRETIHPQIVVAVGDGDTDIPMFEESDVSIYVKNKFESDAWKYATYIVESSENEDIKNILKRLEGKGLLGWHND